MATVKEYLDYAELAQAAYGNLSIGRPNISELKNRDRAKFSQTQAENFANRYEVKAIADSLPTGLDAVLFYDRGAYGSGLNF